MDIETRKKLISAREAIEKDLPSQYREEYTLGFTGGGYADTYSFHEAVEYAEFTTGDEANVDEYLVLRNTADQIIALFYDGRVFIPAELLGS